jgi:hypothetical protein
MARINELHECQGCGVPSDNFATLFFGEPLVDRHIARLIWQRLQPARACAESIDDSGGAIWRACGNGRFRER